MLYRHFPQLSLDRKLVDIYPVFVEVPPGCCLGQEVVQYSWEVLMPLFEMVVGLRVWMQLVLEPQLELGQQLKG